MGSGTHSDPSGNNGWLDINFLEFDQHGFPISSETGHLRKDGQQSFFFNFRGFFLESVQLMYFFFFLKQQGHSFQKCIRALQLCRCYIWVGFCLIFHLPCVSYGYFLKGIYF